MAVLPDDVDRLIPSIQVDRRKSQPQQTTVNLVNLISVVVQISMLIVTMKLVSENVSQLKDAQKEITRTIQQLQMNQAVICNKTGVSCQWR